MRGGLRALLSANGIDVIAEADNGADIVDLVAHLRPDVVLMDLEMPGMDGVAATAALVRRDPDARVLVLTMHADDDSVFKALRAGARGYLVKGSAPASRRVGRTRGRRRPDRLRRRPRPTHPRRAPHPARSSRMRSQT